METLVETTEAFCDAFENLPSSITERIIIERYTSDHLHLSISATLANIRMLHRNIHLRKLRGEDLNRCVTYLQMI